MFFTKTQKLIDKEIMSDAKARTKLDKTLAIDINTDRADSVFSSYDNSKKKLDAALGEYIFDRCKECPLAESVTVNIRTAQTTDETENAKIAAAVKNYGKTEYRDARKSIKRDGLISLVMTLCGIAVLSLLFTLHYFFENEYVSTILEIAAWVFVWEAVDIFFLERPKLKARCIILQKIYTAEVNVIHNH